MRRLGAARRVAVIAAASVTLGSVALLAACGDDDGVDPSGVDADALLERAATRMEQADTFHFELEFDGGGVEIVRGLRMGSAEGDIAGADRTRMELRASLGSLNFEIGIVTIDGEGWITNPLTGRWEREGISLDDVFDLSTGVTALMRSATAPRVAGSESIGGRDVYRVAATLDSDDVTLLPGLRGGESLRATAWIGVDDPLVYRIELEGALFSADDSRMRLELSRYGELVEIVAPR